MVRFVSDGGTFEFNYPTLIDDDQAQLCSTGTLDWSADRVRSVRGSIPSRRRHAPEGRSPWGAERHPIVGNLLVWGSGEHITLSRAASAGRG